MMNKNNKALPICFVLLGAFLLVQAETRNPCGAGWKQSGDVCFQMTKAGTQTHGEATCRALGARSELASILTQAEFDFVKNNYNPSEGRFFIGLKDFSTTATRNWKWTDNSAYTYKAWAAGEPNNARGDERCTEVLLHKGHQWNDLPCAWTRPSLCKKPVAFCGVGWDRVGDSCFQMISKVGTQQQGEASCRALGGRSELASILNQAEFDFVKNNYKPSEGRFFIGLKDFSTTTTRNWKWTDNSAYSYKAWAAGEPNNARGDERCTEVLLHKGHQWNDLPCSWTRPSLCKKPIVSCKEGWKRVGYVCYRMISTVGTQKQGEEACRALGPGSEMASILDQTEFDFVKNNYKPKEDRFFIGLKDYSQTTPRNYKWTDNSAYKYTAWAAGEPNNARGDERCTEAIVFKGHKWNDLPCAWTRPSLCIRPVDGI